MTDTCFLFFKIPTSKDYPYRIPRIDDNLYQAAIPEYLGTLPTSHIDDKKLLGSIVTSRIRRRIGTPLGSPSPSVSTFAYAPTSSKKKAFIKPPLSRPAQRIKDTLERIVDVSAFDNVPERCIWSPSSALSKIDVNECTL